MQRSLGFLTLLAAGLLVVALMLGAGAVGHEGFTRASLKGGMLTVDAISFVLGVVAGICGVALARVPWRSFPAAVLGWMMGWRRNFVLASLGIAFTGVLLFY